MNEHGFGLKNSLVSLSGGNRDWQIWTKKDDDNVLTVKGPFKEEMEIIDKSSTVFPSENFLPSDTSTMIHVKVKLSYIQTVQGRGAKARNLNVLRNWLIEHLGVAYRGYLLQDRETQESDVRIFVSIGNDRIVVPPIEVPMASTETYYRKMVLGDTTCQLEYRSGTLDEVKRNELVKGEKAKYYYQKNIKTQGIDIRLGKRVIATSQFETIWKKEDDGTTPLTRHNNYNEFVGELLIPDLPRGILSTINNKTDFNLDDKDWESIFDWLNEVRPVKQQREKTENAIKEEWVKMLKATNPKDIVSSEKAVWPTATRIDVYREKDTGSIIIYEIKVGFGTPQHLYQLKMYWDGLVIEGTQPEEGILLVEGYNSTLEEMVNKMNQLTPPMVNGTSTEPYNFRIEKHKDVSLDSKG